MIESKIYVVRSGESQIALIAASEEEARTRVSAHTGEPAHVIASGTAFDTFVAGGSVHLVGLTLAEVAS